jgi:hypothetical protein
MPFSQISQTIIIVSLQDDHKPWHATMHALFVVDAIFCNKCARLSKRMRCGGTFDMHFLHGDYLPFYRPKWNVDEKQVVISRVVL